MDSKPAGYACPRCTVGRCAPQRANFCDMLGEQLFVVPKARAHICDVCHFVEFDQSLLDALWERLYSELQRDDYAPAQSQKSSPSYGDG